MIPRIIHNIVGPGRNELVNDCLSSWDGLLKHGFVIKQWDDLMIERFLQENHKFALPAFKNARNHGEAADIARYLIVYSYGGFYADWDVELLDVEKFLAKIAKHPNGMMLLDPPNKTLHPEFFGANMHDSYLFNLVKDIAEIYSNNQRDLFTTPEYSGPFRMRDSYQKNAQTEMSILKVKEVFAYDYREIQDPRPKKIRQPLIHYWMHSWIKM